MAKDIKKRSASHIYFGVDKDTGVSRHISEVVSGAKCNCKCAICGESFEARKGTERKHHFAHVSNYECMYAGEVAVYLGLADVLKKSKKIRLPAIVLRFPTWRTDEIIREANDIQIDEVLYECQKLAYPPMLQVYAGKSHLRIILDFDNYYESSDKAELIAEAKREDYSILMYSMPNINKGDFSPDRLTRIVTDGQQAYWVLSELGEFWKEKFCEIAKTPKKYRGGYLCPISISGKNFAEYRKCDYCEYNISNDWDCQCIAGEGIRHKDDFKKSEDERRATIEKIRLKNETPIQKSETAYSAERPRRFAKFYPKPIAKKVYSTPSPPTNNELEHAYQNIVARFNPAAEEKTVDEYGRRWIKCKICGKIKQDNQMASYGGVGGLNLGICSDCSRNGHRL